MKNKIEHSAERARIEKKLPSLKAIKEKYQR
jgi:hypothetical protein